MLVLVGAFSAGGALVLYFLHKFPITNNTKTNTNTNNKTKKKNILPLVQPLFPSYNYTEFCN